MSLIFKVLVLWGVFVLPVAAQELGPEELLEALAGGRS